MFRHMPFILAFLIAAVLVLDPFISNELKSIFYAISLTAESIVMFVLPIIIFGLLFKVAAKLAKQSPRIIILIMLGIGLSSYVSAFLSHFVGSWIYHFDLSLGLPKTLQELKPYWSFTLPKLIANNKAMFSGLILGAGISLINSSIANKVSEKMEAIVNKLLFSFVYLIPLFVAGFIAKMKHEGVIFIIIKEYSIVFLGITLALILYIGFIYLTVNKFSVKRSLESIKNMLPAAITGFCTMSSASAMPLTIIGVEKNSHNPELAKSIVPVTVNVHLIGDCFAIPIFAYAILKNFGVEEPSLLTFMIFSCYFVLAKFSVAAIPGGGIIVMLPILENYLGFNSNMLSLITALYILFDPVITCANVLGNGGFAMAISKLFAKSLQNNDESKRINEEVC